MDDFVRLKKKLGLNKGFAVSRIGLGGGLVMLLWDNVDIDVQNSSPYYIDALVNQEVVVWRFTDFHGHHLLDSIHW